MKFVGGWGVGVGIGGGGDCEVGEEGGWVETITLGSKNNSLYTCVRDD